MNDSSGLLLLGALLLLFIRGSKQPAQAVGSGATVSTGSGGGSSSADNAIAQAIESASQSISSVINDISSMTTGGSSTDPSGYQQPETTQSAEVIVDPEAIPYSEGGQVVGYLVHVGDPRIYDQSKVTDVGNGFVLVRLGGMFLGRMVLAVDGFYYVKVREAGQPNEYGAADSALWIRLPDGYSGPYYFADLAFDKGLTQSPMMTPFNG